MDEKHKHMMIGIGVGIVVVIAIIIAYAYVIPKSVKEGVSDFSDNILGEGENLFRIDSIKWELPETREDRFGQIVTTCEACSTSQLGDKCFSSSWEITSTQGKSVTCEYYFNGKKEDKGPWISTEHNLKEGTTVIKGNDLVENFDIREDNSVKLCCKSSSSSEVCKEIVLSRAC